MTNSQKILPPFFIIILFFLSLFFYTRLFGPIPFSVISTTTTKTDIFSVSGEGKATVRPDIAYLTVGIEEKGTTVKEVQDKINSAINKVIAALKNLGIAEKDLKTANYNIYPVFDDNNSQQRIAGFGASTNLSIKIRKLENVNNVIDLAAENGANKISSLSFDVEDRAKAENAARKEAVSQAKKKATQAAKAAGFKLGKIINYSENNENNIRPIAYRQDALKSSEEQVISTDIQSGTTEIKIIVNLSYQLE